MDTKTIRGLYDLRQQDLARIFDIPLRTIENWDLRSCMPSYVGDMIGHILERCQVERDPLGDREERIRKIKDLYESM